MAFSTSRQALEARMDLKWREFTTQLNNVQQRTGRRAPQIVQTNSRRLIKKWAFLAPIKTGRLRAGFWPAAVRLQMTNIYTPHPNRGEGLGQLNLDPRAAKPFVRIVNSVPYVANAGGRGTGWWFKGIVGITERMRRDAEGAIKSDWRP